MSISSRITALERRQVNRDRFFVAWPPNYECGSKGVLTDEQRSQLRDGDSVIVVEYVDGGRP